MACMANDECPDAYPRCDVDATNMGVCSVECLSNDDCDTMDKPFCNGDNRCAAQSDGTCQIVTPDDPSSSDPECVGDFTRCMPLSEGSSLGICVECYAGAECMASSSKPQCSTRGICTEANAQDSCENDADCCPTPNASCADRRRCNSETQLCETATL